MAPQAGQVRDARNASDATPWYQATRSVIVLVVLGVILGAAYYWVLWVVFVRPALMLWVAFGG